MAPNHRITQSPHHAGSTHSRASGLVLGSGYLGSRGLRAYNLYRLRLRYRGLGFRGFGFRELLVSFSATYSKALVPSQKTSRQGKLRPRT